MKNNLKLLLCSVLLLIFLLCVNSCGNKNPPVQGTTDSDTGSQEITGSDTDSPETTRDELPGYLDTYTICPSYPEIAEFSMFEKSPAVIAEFGEPILSTNGSLLVFQGYGAHEGNEYNLFPIRIHKRFEATACSDESFFHAETMMEKEEELGIDRTQSYLNFVLDYPNKDEIMAEYDDIILIESAFAEDIVVGEKYLFLMFYAAVDYPHLLYGEYEYEYARGWMPLGDRDMNKPDLVPIKDGKICLPQDFYKNRPGYDHCISRMADMTEEANEKLTQLGLTDNLFRDGMTIDELDEYFNLVTNKETFAPLFEGVETQEP